MDIIKKLNKLRLERDLSVYRLAELSDINQSTLANTFSRGTVPSVKNLEKLCATLGVSMSQFFAEDESPMQLSPREIELIRNFRKLPEELKRSIAGIINTIPNLRD